MKIKASLCTALLAMLPCALADAAPRKVMGENFTATWCGYCPDVAYGIMLLMDEFPDSMFSMQIHGGDAYATTWGNIRQSFYSVPGYPTVWMSGTYNQAGSYGSPNANYQQLRNRYIQLVNQGTDVTINVCGEPVNSNTYNVGATIGIEPDGTSKQMDIHCAQMLKFIPSGGYNYGCFMDATNTTINVSAGEFVDVEFTITLNSASASNTEDVVFFVWAQEVSSSGPANIHQVERHIFNEGDCTIETFTVGPTSDFVTISDALAAAGSGDTVLVEPGTYYENINYEGNSITLRSTDGPEVTVINGGGIASVVRMYDNALSNTVLDGFTITNGVSPVGGGLHTDGNPQIMNCIFVHNEAKMGGGIFSLNNGSVGPTISNTYFCDNLPENIHGEWIDGGGNVFGDDCAGPTCTADVTADGLVDVSDLLAIIAVFGSDDPDADVNSDGMVNVTDLLIVVSDWGPCE